MPEDQPSFDSFSDLLRSALGHALTPAETFLDMFTDDILFEFPYAPDGLPTRLVGHKALSGHLAKISPLLDFGLLHLDAVHPSGETVVFEFHCRGRGKNTGLPYDQTYISVVTLRDGKIARYRDYWNPMIVLSALGGAVAAAAAFTKEEAKD